MKKNPNTADFWDLVIESKNTISPEDRMTRDRIRFISSLIPKLNIRLLDIGVGYSFLEKELEKSKVSTFGIDISPKSILRAKSLYKGFFVVASTDAIPFKNNFFDVVCIPEVLEHLYTNESNLAMQEINRVLKSDGKLIISVPLYDKVYPNHPSGHVRMYTPEKLFQELDRNGFIILKKKYLFAFRSLYFIKSYINRILKIKRPNNLVVLARRR